MNLCWICHQWVHFDRSGRSRISCNPHHSPYPFSIGIARHVLSSNDRLYNYCKQQKRQDMNKRNQHKQNDALGDPINSDNIVSQFITKEFLNNLKLELCQKAKPSKAILEALKHSNTINQTLKRSIEQLNAKISQLIIENQQLKQKIIVLSQEIKDKDNINNSLLYSASLKRTQSQRVEQLKNRENMEAANSNQIQVQILKEKIRHLEEYKSIKQVRFTQIIEREAQYVGQINLLKYKNQALEASVKTLESSLQKMKNKNDYETFQEKLTRKKSETSQKFKNYINQQDGFKSDQSLDEMRQIQHLIIPKNNNLLVSCTKTVDIEEPYHLQSLSQKKNQECQSFNEIDLMLVEEVPNYKTNSIISDSEKQCQENVNSSLIVINVNPQ